MRITVKSLGQHRVVLSAAQQFIVLIEEPQRLHEGEVLSRTRQADRDRYAVEVLGDGIWAPGAGANGGHDCILVQGADCGRVESLDTAYD